MTGRYINKNSKLQKLLRFIGFVSQTTSIIPYFSDVRDMLEEQYPDLFSNPNEIPRLRNLYNSAVHRYKKKITTENKTIKTKNDILKKAKDQIETRLTINPLLGVSAKGKTMVINVKGDKAFFKVSESGRKELADIIQDKALEEKCHYLKRSTNQNILHDELIDASRMILKNQEDSNDATKISYIEKIAKVVK